MTRRKRNMPKPDNTFTIAVQSIDAGVYENLEDVPNDTGAPMVVFHVESDNPHPLSRRVYIKPEPAMEAVLMDALRRWAEKYKNEHADNDNG